MTDIQRSASASRRGFHRLQSYANCPQSFAYKSKLRLLPVVEPEPRALGSLVHIGLQHHYLRRQGVADVPDPVEAMRCAPARIAHTFARAERIYRAYCEHYEAETLQVLDVEREFEVTVGGFPHTARLDLVVRQGPFAIVMDHKTGEKSQGWDIEGQLISQEIIAEATFPDVYGLAYGGIVVNRISTGLTPSFDRIPVTVPKQLKEPMLQFIYETNVAIANDAAKDPWQHRRNFAHCLGKYRCDYIDLCLRSRFALPSFIEAEDQATQIGGSP